MVVWLTAPSFCTTTVLGLLKKIQKRRMDLRVVISSATLDAEAFRDFFQKGSGPSNPKSMTEEMAMKIGAGRGVGIISVEGRTFPVEIHYTHEPVRRRVIVYICTDASDFTAGEGLRKRYCKLSHWYTQVGVFLQLFTLADNDSSVRNEPPGDILVFLTGQDEVETVASMVKNKLAEMKDRSMLRSKYDNDRRNCIEKKQILGFNHIILHPLLGF